MLHQITVDTPFRRLGVGSSLIREIQARCKAMEIGTLVTTYATFNAASAALMSRVGLTPVTTVAEWKTGARARRCGSGTAQAGGQCNRAAGTAQDLHLARCAAAAFPGGQCLKFAWRNIRQA